MSGVMPLAHQGMYHPQGLANALLKIVGADRDAGAFRMQQKLNEIILSELYLLHTY